MKLAMRILLVTVLLASACGPAQAPNTPAPTTTTTSETRPAPSPNAANAPTASAPSGTVKYRTVPDQNEARYRVREQLARLNFPTDAVGATKAVSGTIAIDSNGNVVPDLSQFQVDLSTLRSDEGRRDNFIRQNTLDTATYRYAKFVPKEVKGLPSPPPSTGQVGFQLVGDLTIRDVTRTVTWDVSANLQADSATGQAKTSFTFADFNLTKPTVMVVLSVDDTINLEVDFTLQKVAQ